LHWEVLEDVSVWPPGFQFSGVSVVRSVTGGITNSGALRGNDRRVETKRRTFNVLLVVSRPRPEKDVEYQLVAKSLVAIVDQLSKTNPDVIVKLKILRPPTWHAFRVELSANDYDLVHFDTKGEAQTRDDGGVQAVLEFCKPHLSDPLKMRRDLKTADEVGRVLAGACVPNVVLNACNSASFRDAAPGSNLAEVLLGHGVQSVVAMAYKVVEEAVEIFISVFYQALLAWNASVQAATCVGRSALLNNKSRRARYMYHVRLSDYIVPVLYTSDDSTQMNSPNSDLHSPTGRSPTSIKPTLGTGQRPGASLAQRLRGRDYNILSLEMLLSISRVILVHGQAGVGKTELLRYICDWWKLSGWITAAAFIDFAKRPRPYFSMEHIADSIADQLGLGESERSPLAVIDELRNGKYLVALDSIDAFEAPISIDRVVSSEALPEQLREFIDAISDSTSMVILGSRFSTTHIAPGLPERHQYHLAGLSVLDSVSLLQELSVGSRPPPDAFCRRESIDALRRAAIILEGNPEAIQLIVPQLKKADYNGEALLNTLLYGVCELDLATDLAAQSRFTRSLSCASVLPSFVDFDKTLITLDGLAPFWNLMPKDLNMYYWFLYLPVFKNCTEGSLADWLSDEFRDLVHNARMGQMLRVYWPDIETKLIQAGVLSHATITKNNGDEIPCYHVHPVFTLVSRTQLGEKLWDHARFAYVRQALLWDPNFHKPGGTAHWTSVSWDGSGPQHDDLLHNWRAMAVAWSIQDGNPIEEVDRMGATVLHWVYNLILYVTWNNPRQARLLVPHIRTYLLQAHMIVDLFRPNGIPTESDLDTILFYSWTLWRLERDVIESPPNTRAALVSSALETAARWMSSSSPSSSTRARILPPRAEAYHSHLLFARAATADDENEPSLAKALYEAHLATDPTTTDKAALDSIRSWQVQSLYRWAACVVRLAVRSNRFDTKVLRGRLREVMARADEVCARVEGRRDRNRPGRMMDAWMRVVREGDLKGEMARLTVREQVAFALELEPGAEERFGVMVREVLDKPMVSVFEDVFEEEVQQRMGHGEVDARAGKIEEVLWECLMDVMPAAGGKGRDKDTLAKDMRAMFREAESGLRMIAGNTKGAAAAIQAEIAREELSSTTGRGWQRLADLHRYMYMLTVTRAEEPDYKKGLTHLKEWLRLHQGSNMSEVSKVDQCHGWIKFATCYHALGQLAEAARSVIKLVQTGQTITPADCTDGDVSKAHTFLYDSIAKFKKLDVFLDPSVVFSGLRGVAALSLKERVMMHQIMSKSKEVEQERVQLEKRFQQARAGLIKERDHTASLLQRPTNEDDEGVIEACRRSMSEADKCLEEPEPREPDFWLF
jgi:hypothetical protein